MRKFASGNVENVVEKSLNIDVLIIDKFKNIPPAFLATAEFNQVWISQNGLFFYRNLDRVE